MLDFRLLGPLEVFAKEHPVPIGGLRQRVVLTMLLLNAGRVVSVDTLAEAVWGQRSPSTFRTQLAICISALRKAFRACGVRQPVIETAAPGYVLRPEGHRVDTLVFEELVAKARTAARQRGAAAKAVRLYDSALALRRGLALSNVIGVVPEEAAAQLEESMLAAYEEQVELRLRLGEHRSLVPGLVAAVKVHPFREHLHGLLMTAQYRSGQRVAALETFARWRRRSVEELGLEPILELRQLHERILRDEEALSPGRLECACRRATQPLTGRADDVVALDRLPAFASPQGGPQLGLSPAGPGGSRPTKGGLAARAGWAEPVPAGYQRAPAESDDRPALPNVRRVTPPRS